MLFCVGFMSGMFGALTFIALKTQNTTSFSAVSVGCGDLTLRADTSPPLPFSSLLLILTQVVQFEP